MVRKSTSRKPAEDVRAASSPLHLSIDTDSPTPLYHQIFSQLREAILSGAICDQSYLPSEHDISVALGVSRITAKRSLDELAAAGLAIREQGRGTRVNATPGRTAMQGGISGLVQNLHANARHAVKLIDFGYVVPSPEVAAALGIHERQQVQRASRVWNGPNGPFSYLTTFVPARIGRKWTESELQTKPLISLLEKAGVRLGKAQEQITAIAADAAAAEHLQVKHGVPLLMIVRTVFDIHGAAVEHIVALYPPARYQYFVNLE